MKNKLNQKKLREGIKKALLESIEGDNPEQVAPNEQKDDKKMESDIARLMPYLQKIDTPKEFNNFVKVFVKVAQNQQQTATTKSALMALYKSLPDTIRGMK